MDAYVITGLAVLLIAVVLIGFMVYHIRSLLR